MNMGVRQWGKLSYLNAEELLRRLRALENNLPVETLPYAVRSLRRKDLKRHGEGRQAALFCYGMSKVLGIPVSFAQTEASDYDIVAMRVQDGVPTFTPIQLKEFVQLNPNATADLQTELDKIGKYADSNDLVVAFYLNVRQRVEFSELRFPTNVGELWFYGSNTPDLSKWFLIGDMLREQRFVYEFDYPGV